MSRFYLRITPIQSFPADLRIDLSLRKMELGLKLVGPLVTVPFLVDRSVPIPSFLGGHGKEDLPFQITETILDKMGRVRVTCGGDDCTYVAKFIPLRDYSYNGPRCYTGKDVVRNEILISQFIGSLGIGPRVYGMALNDQQGILVTDRYDGDLNDLFYLYQSDRSIPIDRVLATLKQAIQIMHQNKVVHRDIHPGNIFYSKDGIIAIADFGTSLFSDDPTLRQIDLVNYEGIKEVARKVGSGVPYEKGEFGESPFWYLASPPSPELLPERIYLIWNGHVCNDFV